MIYSVRNWNKLYENNRTRELKKLDWVPVPNKHDGDSFTCLMDMPDGVALFGAWNLILQVASKCDPRGTLLRDGKKPHDAASIARMTRAPVKIVQKALDVFSSSDINWLDLDTCGNPAGGCDNPASHCGNPAGGCLEGKEGKEEKGREQKEEKSPSADRFKIPTLEEVKFQFEKTGLPTTEAEKFFFFYESNGWMVGKNKMKSLPGAIGGWAARSRQQNYENQRAGQENSGRVGSQGQSTRRTPSDERNSFIAGYVEDGPESAANILRMRREKQERLAAEAAARAAGNVPSDSPAAHPPA